MEWGKQDGLGSCSVSPQSHSKGHMCCAVGMGEGNREIVLVNLAPGKDNVYNHLWLWCIHESDRDQELSVLKARCLCLTTSAFNTNIQGINRLSKACLEFAGLTLK